MTDLERIEARLSAVVQHWNDDSTSDDRVLTEMCAAEVAAMLKDCAERAFIEGARCDLDPLDTISATLPADFPLVVETKGRKNLP